MNRLTSFLVAGAVVVGGLAACDDDEPAPTQPPPPPPPPEAVINSVTLTPASSSLPVGGTITLVAVVDATGDIDLTVSWATSDASIATVDASGLVTAVAPGAVAITATSVADANKKASAQITVTEPAPALVTIKSITTAAGAAINPDAVVGLINITLNVDPGDQEIERVEVLMDGEVIGSQIFGSAVSGESESGESETAGEPQVQAQAQAADELSFPFNTAGLGADGVPLFLNVAHSPSARLQLKDGSSVSASSEVKPLTFDNDNVACRIAVSGNSVVNLDGEEWFGGGDVTLDCQPSIYDATSPSTLKFAITGPQLFDNGRSSINAPLGEKNHYSAVIPNSKIGAGDPNLSEDADVGITVSSSRIPTDARKSFRLDNVAPDEPVTLDFVFEDARTGTGFARGAPINNWANASTEFGLDDTGLDGGVGEVVSTLNVFEFDAFTGKDVAGPPVSSGADLAESSASKFKIGVTALGDLLGNQTTLSSGRDLSDGFGVDKTAPSITSVKPSGVAVLNPSSDVVRTFKIRDTRSGLDTDEEGIDAAARREFKAKLGGVSITPGDNVSPADDKTKARIDVSLTVAGANDAAEDGSLSLTGQMNDEAGNVAVLPSLGTTTDNTVPSIPITGAPPAAINAGGAATLTVIMTGSINDANGIDAAQVTGFIDGVQFQVADANIDIISLAEGAFSASFTLKSKPGAAPTYSFEIEAEDKAEDLDGDASPNKRKVTLTTVVTW